MPEPTSARVQSSCPYCGHGIDSEGGCSQCPDPPKSGRVLTPREDEAMTDREKFLALLDEWGVGYNGKKAERNRSDRIDFDHDVMLSEGDDKIDGYHDFFALFEFEPDGAFKQVSVWE